MGNRLLGIKMIPRVNIILDTRQPDRYGEMLGELIRQGITNYHFYPCVIKDNVVESISESFKMIVREAQEKKLKECCIWEDDNFFPNEKGWQYFLDNKPKDFDIYIGGSYLVDNRNEYKKPLVKVREYVGNHCIIIAEKYYQKFLDTDSKQHCDTVQNGLGDFYVCFPMPALQRAGYSANNKAICDYNQSLPKEYIYQ